MSNTETIIKLHMFEGEITINHTNDNVSVTSNHLKIIGTDDDTIYQNGMIDGIEALIVAMVQQGVDFTKPEMYEAVKTAVASLVE